MARPRLSSSAEAADDVQRFEAIFRAHYGAVQAYARRRLPERDEDVVAETFLVAWRRLDRVPDDPLPWLYAVARRVVADLRRSARRQTALAERLAVRDAAHPLPDLPDRKLATALAALSERDRELLLVVHWEGLGLARAAQVLECSRPALATRLWRARRRLSRELEQLGGET